MFQLRGIEISMDAGDKLVKVVCQDGYGDIYRADTRKVPGPVSRGTITAQAVRAFGPPAEKMVWPHHIEVLDIK